MTPTYSHNNIHLADSYKVSKRAFDYYLDFIKFDIKDKKADCIVMEHRTYRSMEREWACHNLLYALHIARHRTKDCDLNYPQKWWEKVGYFLFGGIAKLLIK